MCLCLTCECELPFVSETTLRDQVFQSHSFQQVFQILWEITGDYYVSSKSEVPDACLKPASQNTFPFFFFKLFQSTLYRACILQTLKRDPICPALFLTLEFSHHMHMHLVYIVCMWMILFTWTCESRTETNILFVVDCANVQCGLHFTPNP